MTKRFLTPISLANLSADPTGSAGAFYYNTTSNALKYYNGSTWVTLGTSSANPGGVVFGNSLGNYTSTTAGISGQILMSYGPIANGGPQWVSIAAVESVAVATTANLTGTYANNTPGTTASTFTITATGTLTIDGYLTVLGDRILLKNQSTALQNGIYAITTAGAVGVSAVLTRDNDSDTINKIAGKPVSVGLGTTNGGTQWVNANKTTDTLGTTSIVYNQSLNSASTTSSLTSFGTNATLTTPTINVINATSATSTSAALFSNITTGTIAISANSSSAAATLNILTGATTSGTKTINIGTNGTTTSTTTINIGTTTGTTPTITLNGTVNTASGSFKVGNTTLAQGVTGTITFPATADTLVGRATTDTLTNKDLTSFTNKGSNTLGLGAVSTNLAVSADLTALSANTTGTNSVAVGQNALKSSTVGTDNTAIGTSSLNANTIGINNTAVGSGSLNANTTGSNNTAIGTSSLYYNTTGIFITAVGSGSLMNNTTGSNNTAIGTSSLQNNTTGINNTGVGYSSLHNNTTGSNNTAIGQNAGSTLNGGSNNILLGNAAAPSSITVSNEITLGNASIATLRCQVTAITALSDLRDKKDVVALPVGLDFINGLKPVTFTWNMRQPANPELDDNGKPIIIGKVGQKDFGFIAQDIIAAEDALQMADTLQLSFRNNPEQLEVTIGRLIPILVKAIQELSAEIVTLKTKVGL